MRTITYAFDGLRKLHVPNPILQKRFGISGRSLYIVQDYVQEFLTSEAKWLDVHRIPFKDENKSTYREDFARYSLSYMAKAGAHLGWIKGGLYARMFGYTCDRLPFYWHNQWQRKDGSYAVVNVIRSLFNPHHDKLRMNEDAYREVFYEVLNLLGKKSGPVASMINEEAAALANALAVKQSAKFDFSSQAGNNVGQIIDPCIMIAEGIFEKEYEPGDYALDECPRYYEPDPKNPDAPYDPERVVVMDGATKGDIVHVQKPMRRLCSLDVYDYIVAAVFEKNNLVLHGVLPMKDYWRLTAKTRVLLQFDPNRAPTWWRIMPIGSPHWIPMEVCMRGMKGFDEAVASGLLIIHK